MLICFSNSDTYSSKSGLANKTAFLLLLNISTIAYFSALC